MSLLQRSNQLVLFKETIAIYCENIRNTYVHSTGRIQALVMIMQVAHVATTGL
jgi:hypothetical protein